MADATLSDMFERMRWIVQHCRCGGAGCSWCERYRRGMSEWGPRRESQGKLTPEALAKADRIYNELKQKVGIK